MMICTPSLYFSWPFGAEIYIHPKRVSQLTQKRSATTCCPVLLISSQSSSGIRAGQKTNIRFLSSRLPSLVLIVEFIRLLWSAKYASAARLAYNARPDCPLKALDTSSSCNACRSASGFDIGGKGIPPLRSISDTSRPACRPVIDADPASRS